MEWAWSAVGIATSWFVLHSADYLLTIATARTYARGDLRSRIDLGGRSLELNPVFQRAVDRGAWASRRFLVTLIGMGLALMAIFTAFEAISSRDGASLSFLPELFLGVLVVTRVVVITGHVQNLVLFRRMLRNPAAAGVVVRYDRGTIFTARRWSYAQSLVLCALAVLLTGRPFFVGGAVGMLALVLATMLWQRAEARRSGAIAAPGGPPAAASAPVPASPGRGSFPPA